MNQQPGLPIRAEHVGSLIRPEEIVKARKAAQDTGDIETRQQLATLQQGAIREIVSMQQDLGFASSPTENTIEQVGSGTSY